MLPGSSSLVSPFPQSLAWIHSAPRSTNRGESPGVAGLREGNTAAVAAGPRAHPAAMAALIGSGRCSSSPNPRRSPPLDFASPGPAIPRPPRPRALARGGGGTRSRAAAMYTLIGTAMLNNVDPQTLLADVLARIASTPQNRLGELLPWTWQNKSAARPGRIAKPRLTLPRSALRPPQSQTSIPCGLRRMLTPKLVAKLKGKTANYSRPNMGSANHLRTTGSWIQSIR